jgi:hydroxymethylpyrimidine pyrophosphatase-like HAD family hydrolase/energy-coupling factor transporter ATP-binding protein EcfA2
MRYLALASDYDGTLAHDGAVAEETLRGVEQLIHSGRNFILVTGRELPDLLRVFPRIDLCKRVVAENGAVIYDPATGEKRALAERPPQSFLDALRDRGVPDVSVGEVIVATWRPHETPVMEAIRDAGLELQIVFNKDAVMVLPSGVNKMTGLIAALAELNLSGHNVAGVGDAENDHVFLDSCECSVAVANAIPSLKERADLVTVNSHGEGVVELIGRMIATDLSELDATLRGELILLGQDDERPVTLRRHGGSVLVCGQSGSGKSTLVTGLFERITDLKYQVCLVDPEGDYENLPAVRTFGDEKQSPSIKQLKEGLEDPTAQVVVNLVGVSAVDRPGCFASLIADIQEIRIRTGRPHWLMIDEAHHVLPSAWAPSSPELTGHLSNLVLITVHPGHVSPVALSKINTILVVGPDPLAFVREFAEVLQIAPPAAPEVELQRGETLVWFRDENLPVCKLKMEPPRVEHSRHRRKYAEGELETERSFYFRGPEGKMNLRAQNLQIFLQLAEGVDAETWCFHLNRGDISAWIRESLKDTELAMQIELIEKDGRLPDRESRRKVSEAIHQKYTAAV